jgi:hypothetical protein
MRYRTAILGGLLSLAVGSTGCGGTDFPATPLAPSSAPPQAAVNAPRPGPWPSADYTLRGVSLSGVVYELTPTGRMPIAGAVVYCELCGEETHTFATANDDGFYHFSGDLERGGGVWLAPGVSTPIAVGSYNKDYDDPPGLPASRQGPGWRDVMIDGDTTFDIELVRRPGATP